MALSDAMTTNEKRDFLTSLESGLTRDIMRLCIEIGVDYDSFDYESYETPTPVTQHQQTLLKQACTSLVLVKQKLAAL